MFPILQIGSLAIPLPGLILLLGLWVGLEISERGARRINVRPDDLYNLVFTAFLGGIVGGRVAYIVRFAEGFMASPASVFSLNPGLLYPAGGLAVAFFAAFIFTQRKKLSWLTMLDGLAPLFAVFLTALAVANLASGDGFGQASDLPWAMELWGARRHPSQVYEIAAGLIVLAVVWPRVYSFGQPPAGVRFAQAAALAGLSRLILEAFRGDSATLPNGWRIAQIAAWLVLGASLWGWRALQKNGTPVNPGKIEGKRSL